MPAALTMVGSLVVMLFAMNLAILNPVTAVVGIFLYGATAFSVVAPCNSGSSPRRPPPPM